jgi:hypothetical protein
MTLACGSRLLLDYFVFVFALCERKNKNNSIMKALRFQILPSGCRPS